MGGQQKKRAGYGVLAAAIVIAVVFLVLPGIIGYTAQTRVTSWLKTISQQGAYRIELVDFHRGWFTSTAKSRLVIEGQYGDTLRQLLGADPGTRMELTFDHRIHHGPLLLRDGIPTIGAAYAETGMRLPGLLQALLSPYLKGKPLLTFRTTFGFGGGSTTRISNPGYSGRMGPQTAIRWDGASGKIVASSKAFSILVAMPLFRFEDGARLVLLRDIGLNSRQARRGRHLWMGDTDASIGEIRMMSPESGEAAHVGGLDYRVSLTPSSGDRIDMHTSFGLSRAEFEGGVLGPTAWSLSVRNLSAPALDEAYELYNDFRDADEGAGRRAALDSFLNSSLAKLFDSPVSMQTSLAAEMDGPYAVYKGKTTLGVSGDGGDVAITVDQHLDRLKYGDIALGGGDGRLRIADLDGKVLGNLYTDFVRIVATGMPEDQQEQEMEQVFARKAPQIVTPRTSVHLENVRVEAPDGMVTASGQLGFRGTEPLDYDTTDAALDRLEGSLHLRVPKGVLVSYLSWQSGEALRDRLAASGRDVPEDTIESLARTTAITRMGELEKQSLIRRDGNDFVIDAELADGRVVLNGVEQPDLKP
ncbi:MAG: DUF945 family protein [Alphaproteobacteria bacterium]|nr:DUF945 family protein [Alphaproteobacteria bacterium]